MISRCGNDITASAGGVASTYSAPVGTVLASEGLTLPAILLISVAALPAYSLSMTALPMNGKSLSSEAALLISPMAPLTGQGLPSRLRCTVAQLQSGTSTPTVVVPCKPCVPPVIHVVGRRDSGSICGLICSICSCRCDGSSRVSTAGFLTLPCTVMDSAALTSIFGTCSAVRP